MHRSPRISLASDRIFVTAASLAFTTSSFCCPFFALPNREAERGAEMAERKCFVHFLLGMLRIDPLQRWSSFQALKHPFITKGARRCLVAL